MITRPVPTKKTLIQLDFSLRSHEDPPPLRLQFDENTYLFTPVGGNE